MQKNKVYGVILASGLSKRMGQNKLLLRLNNMTIFENVLKSAKSSDLVGIIVVTSHKEIIEICENEKTNFILNENATIGQSESIKLGTRYFYDKDSIMFITADTPFLTDDTINKLICAYNNEIIVPFFEGERGNPVIFPKKTFDELLLLKNDNGGKQVINSNKMQRIDIKCLNEDIDTIDDYKRAKRGYND